MSTNGVSDVARVRHARDSTDAKGRTKVVLVNRFFHPDESATSQLLTDLAVHLASADQRVVVVTSRSFDKAGKRTGRRAWHNGVEIRRVRTGFGRGQSTTSKLLQYLTFYPGAFMALLSLARRRDTIVVKTDPPLISVVAMIAAKLRGAKLVNWIQDLYPEVAIELRTPLVSGPIGRLLGKLRNKALLVADANVVIGSRMAERLTVIGVRANHIAVIPNWSDESAIRPKGVGHSAARESWGLAPTDFVVGYSGNLGQAHEVETLVGAAKMLRHRPDVKFLFIGGGRQHQRLQELLETEQLKAFIFKPHQRREELSDTLAAADVHWVSLRPELEGLIVPSKLYGILAAGRPVLSIGDRDGEVSSILREHECGIVVQQGEPEMLAAAIERLADDPRLRLQMGRRARAASEQVYAKERSLGAWSTLMSSVAGADERPSARP